VAAAGDVAATGGAVVAVWVGIAVGLGLGWGSGDWVGVGDGDGRGVGDCDGGDVWVGEGSAVSEGTTEGCSVGGVPAPSLGEAGNCVALGSPPDAREETADLTFSLLDSLQATAEQVTASARSSSPSLPKCLDRLTGFDTEPLSLQRTNGASRTHPMERSGECMSANPVGATWSRAPLNVHR
jgi:hypothetical protein